MDAIPIELRERSQWVVWRREQRDGKTTKVLYRAAAAARKASSTDAATWADFETARQAAAAPDVDGLGYVFAADDPFCGVDLDACVTDGETHPRAAEVVGALSSYTERSPSGTGVHVIVRAVRGAGRSTDKTPWSGKFEVYDRARYFTVTGDRLDSAPATIEDRHDRLDAVCAEMFPAPPPTAPRAVAQSVPASDGELIDRVLCRQSPALAADLSSNPACLSAGIKVRCAKFAVLIVLAPLHEGDASVATGDGVLERSAVRVESPGSRPAPVSLVSIRGNGVATQPAHGLLSQ